MSPKNEIVRLLNDFFEWIGVDPLLGKIFLGLLFCLYTLKDLKKWREISSFQKTMYFAIWFGTVVGIITFIIRFFREGY